MRYMTIVKGDQSYESGQMPDPQLMSAIEKLATELMQAGIMIDNGGLLPSVTGARMLAKNGKLTVKDGPFTESKEIIGGYAIMQVRSKEEIMEVSRRFMQLHIDVLGETYQGELEIRQMADPTDCSPGKA